MQTQALIGEYSAIFSLFEQAINAKLKWPRVRLLTSDNLPVVLKLAGSQSKYTGQIMVTDGGPFGANIYYGRIDLNGKFHATQSAQTVSEVLGKLANNPAEVAKEYGKLTGNCTFCDSPLKDARSTANGYGPICAQHYGLQWDI
jgi:Family of unknown function (DUF6011)